MQSADYLAETGDSKWFPLLLKVARKNPGIMNYLEDAAANGGDQALPPLMTMMGTGDAETVRPNVIYALGSTGSRAAVPILMDLLRSPDLATSQEAFYALRHLAHMEAGDSHSRDHPQSLCPIWIQWWNREGITAHIYKAKECGDLKRPD